MGEYAIRKSDGQRIKIGTCEEMYYLRYEDRFKVMHESGNVDPVADATALRFRLPFPDEDDIQPGGNYKDPERSERLCRAAGFGSFSGCEDFTDSSTADDPGIIQLHHESGLLVNVPCYHGYKLPEVVAPMKAFWNGKSWSLELRSLRLVAIDGVVKLFPIVRCRHCRQQWRYEWTDIWEFVPMPLRAALRVYAEPKEVAA